MGQRYFLYGFLVFLVTSLGYSQDPIRFKEEVVYVVKTNDSIWDTTQEPIVFTGSSSVRFWKDLQQRFPEAHILNTGFGGSQGSDLLFYLDELVLHYRPRKVFIYEGDNDLAEAKSPKEVRTTLLEIIDRIHKQLPQTEIVLIAAKPSIRRWELKRKYQRLNRKLKRMANKGENVYFADVWSVMLNGRHLNNNLFIEDGLHMNTLGYDLWYDVIKEYIN